MRRLLGVLLLLASPLLAQCYNTDGDLNFGVQGIYWQPVGCDFHYANLRLDNGILGNPNFEEDTRSFTSRYDWGFRLFATYEQDCNYFDISYAWHRAGHSQCGQQAYIPVGPNPANGMEVIGLNAQNVAHANALLNYRYQKVNLEVGRILHRRCGNEVKAFGNVSWVDLRQQQRIRIINLEGTTLPNIRSSFYRQISDFEGIAFGTGVKGSYCLGCDIHIHGGINPSAVIGRQSVPVFTVFETNTTRDRTIPGSVCVVPAVNSNVGLNWICAGNCYRIEVELGWEIDYYWRVLKIVNSAFNATNFTVDCQDLGWSGPYFGARILF